MQVCQNKPIKQGHVPCAVILTDWTSEEFPDCRSVVHNLQIVNFQSQATSFTSQRCVQNLQWEIVNFQSQATNFTSQRSVWKNGQVREAGPVRSEEEKTRFDKNSIVWGLWIVMLWSRLWRWWWLWWWCWLHYLDIYYIVLYYIILCHIMLYYIVLSRYCRTRDEASRVVETNLPEIMVIIIIIMIYMIFIQSIQRYSKINGLIKWLACVSFSMPNYRHVL